MFSDAIDETGRKDQNFYHILNTKILPPVISKYFRISRRNSTRHSFEGLKEIKNRPKWLKFWEYVETDLILEFLTQNYLR